ncbi:hypothetical protein EV363DRAFT_1178470 [Boletus edulis]|nr:hypothetical protein EV363DRAFT_1178470 [Boletus edulis]
MSLLAHFRLEQGISVVPTTTDDGPPDCRDGALSRSSTFTETPPPPGQGERRPRSDSFDLEEQRRSKRVRQHALDTCRENMLEDDALDQFVEFDIPEMLISVHGKLLAVERSRKKDETHVFLHSDQFKDIMKDRLRSCLLSPNLTGYVTELPENLWSFMKKNTTVFKIPTLALDDPELSEYIDGLMKETLTKQRAIIKAKLMSSIKSKQHVSLLARSLAQTGYYEVTTNQWARFAFLRGSMVTFNDLVIQSMAKTVEASNSKDTGNTSNDPPIDNNEDPSGASDLDVELDDSPSRLWISTAYWEYIDLLLIEIRTQTEAGEPTLNGRKKKLDAFFTECLQGDFKKYPDTKRNCAVPYASELSLSDTQRSIHQGLMWC